MFILIEITTYNDGTAMEQGMYHYDTLNDAVSKFHTKMGGMMAKENVATELLTIIDSNGAQRRTEIYVKPVEVVEEEQTEEVTE